MGLGSIVAKGLAVVAVGGVVVLGVAAAGVAVALKAHMAWADFLAGKKS